VNSPFDRALETGELHSAAQEFALQHGEPGTLEYRSAWIRFRQRVRTRDELTTRRSSPTLVRRARSEDEKRDSLVREVLNAAIERAMRIDGAATATAQFVEPHSHALRLVAHQGFSAEFLDFFEIVEDATTACGSALERGAPVLISDITESPVFARTVALEVMLRAGSRAVASFPVRAPHGGVIAMISTHHPRTTTWTERRMSVIRDLCGSAGLLLHHLSQKSGAEQPAA
jgi:GAF domain